MSDADYRLKMARRLLAVCVLAGLAIAMFGHSKTMPIAELHVYSKNTISETSNYIGGGCGREKCRRPVVLLLPT